MPVQERVVGIDARGDPITVPNEPLPRCPICGCFNPNHDTSCPDHPIGRRFLLLEARVAALEAGGTA